MGLQFKVMYKKGIHNGAADSLSRKPVDASQLLVISEVQPIWLEQVVASYSSDVFAQRLLQRLAIDPQAKPDYSLNAGILRYKSRMWISDDAIL